MYTCSSRKRSGITFLRPYNKVRFSFTIARVSGPPTMGLSRWYHVLTASSSFINLLALLRLLRGRHFVATLGVSRLSASSSAWCLLVSSSCSRICLTGCESARPTRLRSSLLEPVEVFGILDLRLETWNREREDL